MRGAAARNPRALPFVARDLTQTANRGHIKEGADTTFSKSAWCAAGGGSQSIQIPHRVEKERPRPLAFERGARALSLRTPVTSSVFSPNSPFLPPLVPRALRYEPAELAAAPFCGRRPRRQRARMSICARPGAAAAIECSAGIVRATAPSKGVVPGAATTCPHTRDLPARHPDRKRAEEPLGDTHWQLIQPRR